MYFFSLTVSAASEHNGSARRSNDQITNDLLPLGVRIHNSEKDLNRSVYGKLWFVDLVKVGLLCNPKNESCHASDSKSTMNSMLGTCCLDIDVGH